VLEPWAHGAVARATRYPHYWDFNVVRVEDDPAMDVDSLAAFAEQALAGLDHRRIDFDLMAAADPLRADFEAKGWHTMRLLWMLHDGSPLEAPAISVEEVPYDAVHNLRVAGHLEDFPDQRDSSYHAQAREVAMALGVQVLAIREGSESVAFAQLQRAGGTAEISEVYVLPDYRGSGRGTAMTAAAIRAAGTAGDLWICADDEDRPKELYARLGFRPAWTTMEFTLRPRG